MLRFLTGPAHALKRVHWRRSLRVRTSTAMAKARPSRLRPLTLRLLSAPARAQFLTIACRAILRYDLINS